MHPTSASVGINNEYELAVVKYKQNDIYLNIENA
jgi:hypothetical protein